MSYTISAARYGNSENTAATITTDEAGDIAVSEADTPGLWADFLAWVAGGGVPTAYGAPARYLDRYTFYRELVTQTLYGSFNTWLASQADAVKAYFTHAPGFLEDDAKIEDAMMALRTTPGDFYTTALT
ncbi:hypothetical protein [Microvirga sp. M2]|uniref:hypothetical protein n=1 Tax=Microvirga sp. M2 TaxID=3073270 RepID=UPI0039C1F992